MIVEQKMFWDDLLKPGRKPPEDVAEAFYRSFKLGNHDIAPYSKFIQDTFWVNLEELEDEFLLLLHHNTKWIAPSYLLRKRHGQEIEGASEEVLLCLVQMQSQKAFDEWSKRHVNNSEKAPDELLVLWHKEGHKEALDILTMRHKTLIKNLIRQQKQKGRFFRGMDDDDIFQESMTGYLKAVKDFKIERKMKFTVFTRFVIEKYLDTIINQSKNTKNSSLNDSFSFHAPIRNDAEMTFEESFVSDLTLPDELVVKKETFYAIWDVMTSLEKEVLLYYASGHSYEEIGELIQKDRKAVDNTIQRFRSKAEKYDSTNF